jgi:hypothetical protein
VIQVSPDSLKGKTHYLKAQAQGETIQLKFWEMGDDESNDWQSEVTDPTFS